MKGLFDILTIIESDAGTVLPDMLYESGLDDFAVYKSSHSRDPRVKGFFVYPNNSVYEYDRNYVSLIVQLQLFEVDAIEAARYADVVSEYLINFDPAKIGAQMIDSISVDTWPPDGNRTSFVYFDIGFVEMTDSCDQEG